MKKTLIPMVSLALPGWTSAAQVNQPKEEPQSLGIHGHD